MSLMEQTMKRTLTIAIAAGLGATGSIAGAVMLNPRGTGQVLIYPYYTVNHQQTLVSVINTTAHGKALKVRFREGYDGRDVANFNVYLGPYDSWVGAVYDSSSDGTGAAAIATNDNSCTVPEFPLAPVPGILHALTFSNVNYSQGDYGTPTGTDHGPTNLARTREGFFEIIEMGEVVDQASDSPKTLEAISNTNQPPGCAQVVSAWGNGGYWLANATTDLSPPAGGMYGSAGIVDVAEGTLYSYDATAIDGFSDFAQHTAPNNPKPNLGTAVTDSAHDTTTAYVTIDSVVIKADYPASTRGVDAVSAVLMSQVLYNEFNSDPGLGAQSDFLITYPTKQFYVDPGIVGTQSSAFLPPFGQVFGGAQSGTTTPGKSCIDAVVAFIDRRGGGVYSDSVCGLPPVGPTNKLCLQTEAFTLGAHASAIGALGASLRGTLLQNDQCGGPLLPVPFDLGNVSVIFPQPEQQLRAAFGGQVFAGFPAIGFVATNYVNANVMPGVLSNYSGTYPHRAMVWCFDATTRNACQ